MGAAVLGDTAPRDSLLLPVVLSQARPLPSARSARWLQVGVQMCQHSELNTAHAHSYPAVCDILHIHAPSHKHTLTPTCSPVQLLSHPSSCTYTHMQASCCPPLLGSRWRPSSTGTSWPSTPTKPHPQAPTPTLLQQPRQRPPNLNLNLDRGGQQYQVHRNVG